MKSPVSRRHFLQAGIAAAAASRLPPLARAASPNGKLRTAHIGVGGMGMSDLRSIMTHPQVEVAALCDVDSRFLETAAALHPNAKKYPNQRLMIVTWDGYAYLVPYVEESDYFFLETIIPSRKATRDYLKSGGPDDAA
mgnify:CR=1 FL=1